MLEKGNFKNIHIKQDHYSSGIILRIYVKLEDKYVKLLFITFIN